MAHSQNIHLRATFPHLFIRPVVRRLQFHCKTHPHQRRRSFKKRKFGYDLLLGYVHTALGEFSCVHTDPP